MFFADKTAVFGTDSWGCDTQFASGRSSQNMELLEGTADCAGGRSKVGCDPEGNYAAQPPIDSWCHSDHPRLLFTAGANTQRDGLLPPG